MEVAEVDPLPPSREARQWAMLAHLSALLGYFAVIAQIVGPLVIWLIKREGSAFVNDQGREAVNFNLSVLVYSLIAGATMCIAIGYLLLPLVVAFHVTFTILAAIRAQEGRRYRYPLTIRLLT